MENTARDYSEDLNMARTNPANLHVPQAADEGIKYGNDNDADGDNHTERLEKARAGNGASEAKKAANLAGDLAGATTPMGAFSLLKNINVLGDIPYVAALVAGILKDLFDAVTFETVVIPFVFSALFAIFTFMMMLLVGGNGKKKAVNGILKKFAMIMAGMIVGFIPGLNIIPEATSTALAVYIATLSERKHASK